MRNILALCPTVLPLVNDYDSRGIIICFNKNRIKIPQKVLFQKTHIDSYCILKLCVFEYFVFVKDLSFYSHYRPNCIVKNLQPLVKLKTQVFKILTQSETVLKIIYLYSLNFLQIIQHLCLKSSLFYFDVCCLYYCLINNFCLDNFLPIYFIPVYTDTAPVQSC